MPKNEDDLKVENKPKNEDHHKMKTTTKMKTNSILN